MSDAVRLISISRATTRAISQLVAFAAPVALHGVDVARELAIPVVIVPPESPRRLASSASRWLGDMQHELLAKGMGRRRRSRLRHIEGTVCARSRRKRWRG